MPLPKTQYVPLALKYRPKKFLDLMGQRVLVQTLSSAIINSRLSHAYLLTGIRGVGKTTSARLIASAVNCENPVIKDQNVESCGKCNNCTSFINGGHPDIIEIDAASRTSVDDVRSIIESSEYKPLLGKYKIFIIDEVHMISKNAFNALLKTLEEPPRNVIFIFATTEVNKIPITILSRCQRFDLRRLAIDEITSLLTSIAKAEEIDYDEKSVALIALKAGGSARDAVSMLDQASLLSTTENQKLVTLELVQSMLGISSQDVVISFVENILKQDAVLSLQILNNIHSHGSDLICFMENALDVIGYLTKLSAVAEYKNDEYTEHNELLKNIASSTGVEVLTVLWQVFAKAIIELKTSHNQLLSAEMSTIKAIYAAILPSPREALEYVAQNPIRPRQSS